ncbi:MAG: GNAT family N-acetyltransferase [Nocardioides sp.]
MSHACDPPAKPRGARSIIRLAEPSDFLAVGQLTVEAYVAGGHVGPADSYLEVLRNCSTRATHAQLWVAIAKPHHGRNDDRGTGPVGTVTYCPPGSPFREIGAENEGEFRALAVSPAAHGRGIGAALVAHCIKQAQMAGHTGVVLSTLPSQRAAHRIYQRLGFSRDPGRDWSPTPHTVLWAFRLRF